MLRGSDAPMFATGVKVRKTGDTYRLAATQLHHMVDASGVGKEKDLEPRDIAGDNAKTFTRLNMFLTGKP